MLAIVVQQPSKRDSNVFASKVRLLCLKTRVVAHAQRSERPLARWTVLVLCLKTRVIAHAQRSERPLARWTA